MDNSKLLALAGTFTPREWKAFGAFVASPYFNRNPLLVQLAGWLRLAAGGLTPVGRDPAWQALFPGRPRDDRQLNHLMSQLLELAEDFVGTETCRAAPAETALYRLQGLSSRGLDKHYRFIAEQQHRALAATPCRDAQHFLWRYRLHDLERAHFDRLGIRRLHESAQTAADSLDFFYLTEKLKYTCAMLNSQAVVATPFHLHFLDEIRQALQARPLPLEAPGVAVYFRILQLLTRDSADDDFQALKMLLPRLEGRFTLREMATFYEYALNYCIRQIRQVRENYVEEALDLYEQGISSGILLSSQGRLSPWHFKNIVKLALRLRRFDWAERFIREKHELLHDEFKADALHYNLAELYFYTHRYDDALLHLNRVEFTDVHYNLGAKVMLVKIYCETAAFDALESLLNTFKVYLRRNKIISEDVRRAYLNFIQLLRRYLRETPNRYAALRQKVENTPLLTEKNWLLDLMR